MILKSEKGSITLFVLVGLLFMTAFLIIAYGRNVNNSKVVKEQFDIISDIYMPNDNIVDSYTDAFSTIVNKNKQNMIRTVDNSSTIELTKTIGDNINNLKIYGNGNEITYRYLPEEYQQIKYIESTGTQYINSNFIPTGKALRIITDFEYVRKYDGLSLFGNNSDVPYCLTVYGSKPTFWIGNSKGIDVGFQTKLNTRYTLDTEINNGTLTAIWNGQKYTASYTGELNTQNEYYIFGANSAKGAVYEKGNGYRLYGLKIYDDNNLERDFVPCYRKADNEIGLYDLVENKFYTNAGTEKFVISDVVDRDFGDLVTEENDLNYGKYKISIKISNEKGDSVEKNIFLNEPLHQGDYIDYKAQKVIKANGAEENIKLPNITIFEDYTKIEFLTGISPNKIIVEYLGYTLEKIEGDYTKLLYIESTGSQYIDTNFKPSGNALRIVTNFEYVRKHDDLSLFGNNNGVPYCLTVYGSKPTFWVGETKNIDCGIQTDLNTKYTLDVEVNNGTLTAICNGEEYTASYTGELNTEQEYYIFGANTSKGAAYEKDNGYRLYGLKIYDNDTLVRDFVPCYRKADNEIGLYDMVEKKFYTNSGTGKFLPGPEK